MRAFAFVRWKNPILGVDVGHVGWGFELPDGRFCCGATENVDAHFQIPPGQRNEAWYKLVPNLQAMLQEMRLPHFGEGNQYNAYKCVSLTNAYPDRAYAQAKQNLERGFGGLGNNCLDHMGHVLEAYGVPWHDRGGNPRWGMPWKQTNPAPNQWFGAWVADGKSYQL